MEFIVPMGTVRIGDRELSNTRISISDKYVFVMGIGPDGTYEERLLEVGSGDAAVLIGSSIDYLRKLLDLLDNLLVEVGREVGVNVMTKHVEIEDAVRYLLARLGVQGEYLRVVGDGWRRILDSARLGRVGKALVGEDRIYVIYSGNNITLNLVAEPIEGGIVEVVTYTEGKVTGVTKVRVGEDVVVKTDIRSPSSLLILSQTKNPEQLGTAISDVAVRVRGHVVDYANKLLNVMRSYGTI
jgi:hypothetical protein